LWDADDEILKDILKLSKYYKIIIFSKKFINFDDNNVYITHNLHEYASYINNINCLAVISILSGGGQLASYCSNSKLFMYFHPSQTHYGLNSDELNNYILSENAFDFCEFTNAQRSFISLNDISNLNNFIID